MEQTTEAYKTGTATRAAASPRCLACGSSDLTPLYSVNSVPIHRCNTCGTGRALVDADFDASAIYTAEYFNGGHTDGYADYVGSQAVVRREFQSTLKALRRHVPTGRLLEVGCAYGFFLQEAKEYFEATGLDVAQDAIEHCRKSGLDAHATPANAAFVKDHGPFDAVVMLDVIEHLERPDEVVRTLSDGMRPGAHLLLTTGDYGSLLSRTMGAAWRLMTPPQHLHFFSTGGIERLLENAGLQIVEMKHPWKVVPMELVAYQLGRALKLQRILRRLPRLEMGLPVNLFDAMRVIAVKR